MDNKPVIATEIDQAPDPIKVPVLFIGIAARMITKNPFRKKGRLLHVLTGGAMYAISDEPKDKLEQYMQKLVVQWNSEYKSIPFTDEIRSKYKRTWGVDNNGVDSGKLLHYWASVYNGLRFVVLEIKEIESRVAFVFGNNQNIDIPDLLKLALMQIPKDHPLMQRFLKSINAKEEQKGLTEL